MEQQQTTFQCFPQPGWERPQTFWGYPQVFWELPQHFCECPQHIRERLWPIRGCPRLSGNTPSASVNVPRPFMHAPSDSGSTSRYLEAAPGYLGMPNRKLERPYLGFGVTYFESGKAKWKPRQFS